MNIFDVFVAKVVSKLPFTPNETQLHTLSLLADFLLSPTHAQRVFVLRGYAGTGKTSLISAVVQAMKEGQMKSCLMAPTGRAAKVFSAMSGSIALTIHKCIYRQERFDAEPERFDLMDNLHRQTLFICDEASMISTLNDQSPFGTGNLLDDLIEYVYAGVSCRLLLVGDDAQLPPVGQKQSPALSVSRLRGYGLEVITATLTEVARQQLDSGILWNATELRRLMSTGIIDSLPRLRTLGFPDVRCVYGHDLIDTLSDSYHRQGVDDTIIITRSNARANRFNIGVRNLILDYDEELSGGDRLLIVRNNYFWCRDIEGLPFLANGDTMQIRRIRNVHELYGFRFAEASITLPDYDHDAEVMLLLDTLQSEGPSLSAEDQSRLFWSVMEDYADIPSKRERLKAVRNDRHYNALQVKYAYAVTCHKSQGGQWSDVYLDLSYINPEHTGIEFYRWLYTALTRAREHLFLVNIGRDMLEEGEAIDLD